ncbi:MAG: hypothetical protein IRY95_10755, partial [Clostridia bacterium]|nr:hypothetical protein [Clostridia bacterium]
VGEVAAALGAGRRRKGAPVHPGVGVELTRKLGDTVAAGEPLAWVHARDADSAAVAVARLQEVVAVGPEPPSVPPVVHEVIRPLNRPPHA